MVSQMTLGGIDLTDDPWAAIDRLPEGIDDALLRAEPARYGRGLSCTYPSRERRLSRTQVPSVSRDSRMVSSAIEPAIEEASVRHCLRVIPGLGRARSRAREPGSGTAKTDGGTAANAPARSGWTSRRSVARVASLPRSDNGETDLSRNG